MWPAASTLMVSRPRSGSSLRTSQLRETGEITEPNRRGGRCYLRWSSAPSAAGRSVGGRPHPLRAGRRRLQMAIWRRSPCPRARPPRAPLTSKPSSPPIRFTTRCGPRPPETASPRCVLKHENPKGSMNIDRPSRSLGPGCAVPTTEPRGKTRELGCGSSYPKCGAAGGGSTCPHAGPSNWKRAVKPRCPGPDCLAGSACPVWRWHSLWRCRKARWRPRQH